MLIKESGVIITKKYTGFFTMWLVNAVLLWLANMLFPANYVLGSMTMSVWSGTIVTALLWTVLIWLTQPLANKLKIKLKGAMQMMLAYLVSNFVVLWLLSRFGPAIGFGVSGWMWVLALAIVANIVQYLNWMVLAKYKLAKM